MTVSSNVQRKFGNIGSKLLPCARGFENEVVLIRAGASRTLDEFSFLCNKFELSLTCSIVHFIFTLKFGGKKYIYSLGFQKNGRKLNWTVMDVLSRLDKRQTEILINYLIIFYLYFEDPINEYH